MKNSTAQVYKEISSKSDGSEQTLDEQIISANQVQEIMKGVVDPGKDIASLSNKSKYIFVKDSGHYIQKDKPQIVIDSIEELIATVSKYRHSLEYETFIYGSFELINYVSKL